MLHSCLYEVFDIQGVLSVSSMSQLGTTIPDSEVPVSCLLVGLCAVCFTGVLSMNSHNSSVVDTTKCAL